MSNALPAPDGDETLDRLAGEWWIFQLRSGQRYSTDDLLTAWTGHRCAPRATQILDLGAGVGAVGLLSLLLAPPDARLTSVEVLQISAALQAKTVAYNGLADRVRICNGDLRDSSTLDGHGPFDLITANPPYIPEGNALRSPHPQRASARLELHGDVFDFCRVAAGQLAREGRFVFSHAAFDPRPEHAVEAAGLHLLARQRVIFREGKPATIALHTCALEPGPFREVETMVVRAEDGGRTAAFRGVRRDLLIEA